MHHLDLQVIERALQWANQGLTVWLCTVLKTFGSSPREPGAMLVACDTGEYLGSLSGGCVEEDFIARLHSGEFAQPVQRVSYGGDNGPASTYLPCGGSLEVLVERLAPTTENLTHLEVMHATLLGRQPLTRCIKLDGSGKRFNPANNSTPAVTVDAASVNIRIGPALRLIIAGISSISSPCALFAQSLGFEVIVCDPRDAARKNFAVTGVEVQAVLPSVFIASGGCHANTAVVALTHDPRIDDLAMIEAVRTEAFYIGVMGSQQTSQQRAERLLRSGGLTERQVARIAMPIGLNLGSKTPAEIALAVMADIVRLYRGKQRHAL
ncbi:XdhC family protein [Halomonas sp. ISL-60]|uniref:XdhC family protein n=1 Tax=Halomonas sp. ISL-56 TaxID=2819149 RepID=UPI001BECA025|nr:XdhC family protein [Halomonas sp. ISL-56]MBT2772585.1 XdhC family protein [Halomonas sp. ISL-60]MBT2801207.1 XdhC family protein [Halomonas sp. ISL-56]